MKDGWFGPTGLGIGLRPTGLQGWLVTVIFLLAAALLARLTSGIGVAHWICMGWLVTVYFIIVMLTKMEKA
jgi:hypothetical protein